MNQVTPIRLHQTFVRHAPNIPQGASGTLFRNANTDFVQVPALNDNDEPEEVNPFPIPVIFTIPARQLFSVRVFFPQDSFQPRDPLYVVRVTTPVGPI